jgi:GTPase SAR1 family protein
MGGVFGALRDKLYTKKIELVVLGLENSGKTTFLN